jgi:hypothetical protein
MKSLVKIDNRAAWVIAVKKRIKFIEDYRKNHDDAYEKIWAEKYHRRPWIRWLIGPSTEKPYEDLGDYPCIRWGGILNDAKHLLKVLENEHYTDDIFVDIETVNIFTSSEHSE